MKDIRFGINGEERIWLHLCGSVFSVGQWISCSICIYSPWIVTRLTRGSSCVASGRRGRYNLPCRRCYGYDVGKIEASVDILYHFIQFGSHASRAPSKYPNVTVVTALRWTCREYFPCQTCMHNFSRPPAVECRKISPCHGHFRRLPKPKFR